jgi:hypothetical protein
MSEAPSSNGGPPESAPSGGVLGGSDLAPDGVDERQLAAWERACAEDMRKALRVRIKSFPV